MTRLDGKCAFVTGASGGIGRASALELARRGARVALHYFRDEAGAKETASMIARDFPDVGQSPVVAADLSTADNAKRCVQEATAALSKVDILVNNAGDLIERRSLAEMDDSLWQRVMDVNVTSVLFCCQAVAAGMVERKSGSIINLSSLAAWNGGGAGAAPYSAAKGAVVSMSKALAKELSPHGVRVNCVSPGLIGATDFHARFTPQKAFEGVIQGIPLGRAGTPEDVAGVVGFLAGEESAYLTGETIEVNGGLYMR